MRAAAVSLALAAVILAQTKRDPEELPALARDKILERTERLPDYTCVQTVDRTYLKRTKAEFPVPSCAQIKAERTSEAYVLKVHATDRLRLDVKVSDGNEVASWPGASHFESGFGFVEGPFGTGPFGTLLMDIFSTSSVKFTYGGEEPVDGVKLSGYRFRVPLESSHYMVHAGVDWPATGYDGAVWIDPRSFELRRLMVRTNELPEETGECEATTTVEYARAHIGTGDFLLPQHSSLQLLSRDATETEISTVYSNCHQYHGEAQLVAEPNATVDEPKLAPPASRSIPAGLAVLLKLATQIDTDTAAAGDRIVQTVSKPVLDPKSREVVIPAGSTVRGRIVRMQHQLAKPSRFVIAMLLDTVEIDGVRSPFYAKLDYGDADRQVTGDLKERGRPIYLPPRGSALVASFFFYKSGSRYVVPRGYESKWVTVAAPAPPK